MRLCWNGEGQKYYPPKISPETGYKCNALSLSWWQNRCAKIHQHTPKKGCWNPRSRYLLQSQKNDTAVPGRHRNTILLNIEVKGYTLYAGKEKSI